MVWIKWFPFYIPWGHRFLISLSIEERMVVFKIWMHPIPYPSRIPILLTDNYMLYFPWIQILLRILIRWKCFFYWLDCFESFLFDISPLRFVFDEFIPWFCSFLAVSVSVNVFCLHWRGFAAFIGLFFLLISITLRFPRSINNLRHHRSAHLLQLFICILWFFSFGRFLSWFWDKFTSAFLIVNTFHIF